MDPSVTMGWRDEVNTMSLSSDKERKQGKKKKTREAAEVVIGVDAARDAATEVAHGS